MQRALNLFFLSSSGRFWFQGCLEDTVLIQSFVYSKRCFTRQFVLESLQTYLKI